MAGGPGHEVLPRIPSVLGEYGQFRLMQLQRIDDGSILRRLPDGLPAEQFPLQATARAQFDPQHPGERFRVAQQMFQGRRPRVHSSPGYGRG